MQVEACLEIAEFCKNHSINVWCYTGFTFEELLKKARVNVEILELLNNIDVLVDGKFLEKQKNLSLTFKGSKNQRILDIPESLEKRKAIEVERYIEKPAFKYAMDGLSVNNFGKVQYMFI